jgi:hypothetical protein
VGGAPPSGEALRQFLYAFHDEALIEKARQERRPKRRGTSPKENAALRGLAQVKVELIQRGFATLPETVEERYFCADSACYDEKVLKWLSDDDRPDGPKGKIGFTISADMTKSLHEVCEAVAEADWALMEERAEETVCCAEVEFTPGDWPKDAWPLRYLAVRMQKKQGRLFAAGYDTKYLAVVKSRDGAVAELLRWHWEKAGTIELVHDVTKNELTAAVPPCGRFGANAAWYRLVLLTYNVLSAMKSLALPSSLSSARPKRLALLRVRHRRTDRVARRPPGAAYLRCGLPRRRRLASPGAARNLPWI